MKSLYEHQFWRTWKFASLIITGINLNSKILQSITTVNRLILHLWQYYILLSTTINNVKNTQYNATQNLLRSLHMLKYLNIFCKTMKTTKKNAKKQQCESTKLKPSVRNFLSLTLRLSHFMWLTDSQAENCNYM